MNIDYFGIARSGAEHFRDRVQAQMDERLPRALQSLPGVLHDLKEGIAVNEDIDVLLTAKQDIETARHTCEAMASWVNSKLTRLTERPR